MHGYVLRRMGSVVPVLFLSSILVFLLIYLIPGDPALALLPPDPRPEQIRAVREIYGFDRPLLEQYTRWLRRVVDGDLGQSISKGAAVGRLLRESFAVTAQLAASAFALALLIALPLGVAAGLRPEGRLAMLLNVYATIGLAVPAFWVGILFILAFGVWLQVLPTSGFRSVLADPIGAVRFMVLPAVTLSLSQSAVLASFLRYSVQGVRDAEYVTAAVANGLPRRLILSKVILKNALIPVVTVAALQLGHMLGGTVVIESVFSIPGLGRLLVDAIAGRDYPVIQGALLLILVVFIALNFATDLLYSWLDPRIRLQ
jgi:peptide/nickel transport system permease protein